MVLRILKLEIDLATIPAHRGYTNLHLNLFSHLHTESSPTSTTSKGKWAPQKYLKQEIVGQGSFGTVYKCFDTDSEKYFVLKETFSQDPESLTIARNEINRLQVLDHPRIIDYYGYKTDHSGITIFMEYMTGGSLGRIIHKYGPISETTSIKHTDQILEALAFIHNKGIVHCDLKCDNILSDGHGNIKLGDFGIAVQKGLNSANQTFFTTNYRGGGSYFWAAPEVLDNQGCCRSSDLWSLGCTITEMLIGNPPYIAMPMPKFMIAIENKSLSYDPEELVPDASYSMKQFLSHLLQYDPKNRPNTGAEARIIFRHFF